MSSSRSTKRKLKPGLIELDPVEPTIIVHLVTQTVSTSEQDDDGRPLVLSSESESKRFKLKSFTVSSNIAKFAAALKRSAVVSGAEIIHESKIPLICNLLEQLRDRMANQSQSQSQNQDDEHEPNPGHSQPQSHTHSQGQHDTSRIREDNKKSENEKYRPTAAASTGSSSSSTSTSASTVSINSKSKPNNSSAAALLSDDLDDLSSLVAVGGSHANSKKEINLKAKMKMNLSDSESEESANEEELKNRPKPSQSQQNQSNSRSRPADASRSSSKSHRQPAPSDSHHSSSATHQRAAAYFNSKPREKAQISQLDNYLESLYEEDMKLKIRGTGLILQLVQDPINLQNFLENATLIQALSRVLQEDRKKSTDLITNILEIFFCFSSFLQLHPILISNKVGDTTMKIIDLELRRYELNEKNSRDRSDEELIQFYLKQERLMFVCYYILLNLSEDIKIEMKMKQRKIIPQLIRSLKRRNPFDNTFLDELHLLIITFLKKLSIFEENNHEMKEEKILKILSKFLNIDNEDLNEASLRLLFNLSFDKETKAEMLFKRGIVPICGEILQSSQKEKIGCRIMAVRILYNISIDEEMRSELENSIDKFIPPIIRMLEESKGKLIDRELMALLINLSFNPALAAHFQPALSQLIARVYRTFDPLLMKFLHNLASTSHADSDSNSSGSGSSGGEMIKFAFARQIHELLNMMKKSPTPEFLVAAIGTVGALALNSSELNCADLIREHNLVEFAAKQLNAAARDHSDDILLNTIILMSTLINDSRSAKYFSDPRLVALLFDLLNEKMEDVEIILQIIYFLYKLLLFKESRNSVLANDNLIAILLDLVIDPCPAIRKFSNSSLDLIAEFDAKWRERIKSKRFEAFNREWLKFIHSNSHEINSGEGDRLALEENYSDNEESEEFNKFESSREFGESTEEQ